MTNDMRLSSSVEDIQQLIAQFLAQATSYHELTLQGLADFTGRSIYWLQKEVLPPPQWPMMRDRWADQRLRQAMEDLYQKAKTREDFSAECIAKMAGVPTVTLFRLMKAEWQQLFNTLPTPRERITALVWQLVEDNIPLSHFTRAHIAAVAGVKIGGLKRKWFSDCYRAAYLKLAQQQKGQETVPPQGANLRLIADTWIDLDSESWDLRAAGLRVLKRNVLRRDIALIAWPLLREELRTGERAFSTVAGLHWAFCVAGRVLGEDIPDVRLASLETLQRAWVAYPGRLSLRRSARVGLLHVFEALLTQVREDSETEQNEWLRIVGWLRDLVALPHDEPASVFLSEEELHTILTCCFADIQAGLAFMSTASDLLSLSHLERSHKSGESPRVLIYWATALMILIMTCTGLRRQSVVSLEIHDWMELRPGLFGLIWRHWKKGEEHLVVISSTIAQLLQAYVERTTVLRDALLTGRVFLNGTARGLWRAMSSTTFEYRLRQFVHRHQLERQSTPLALGSTLFRRTYTTRSLYEGRSLEALRSQLGHTTVMSTLLYSKLDLFEHPAQVRAPLDVYGRHALTLWKTPLLLGDLESDERVSLLNTGNARHQEVGLCRHDRCVQLAQGSPPPCSLCEHLVTGSAFLPAWHAEYLVREQTMKELEATAGAEVPYAQMKGQFDQFKRNLAFVQMSCEG